MFTSLIFSTALCFLPGMAVYNHSHLMYLLVSENWEQRREAYWFAKKAEWSLRVTSPEFLMNVIKRNHFVPRKTKLGNDEDARCTPRHVAIAILAEWALPEATSIFIEHIVHPSDLFYPPGVSSRTEPDFNLPVRALTHLGKQVAKPIVKELAAMGPVYHLHPPGTDRHYIVARTSYLVKALENVVGYRQARQLVQEEAKRMHMWDPFGYANLMKVDEMIKSHERVGDP